MPDCISAMKKLSASSGLLALEANSLAGRVASRGLTPGTRLWFVPETPHCGPATGGVRTNGGRGLGNGRATPGAGRTSIGGGSGATCWLTMGGGGLDGAGGGSGRGATILGFNGTRRGSRPGIGTSEGG